MAVNFPSPSTKSGTTILLWVICLSSSLTPFLGSALNLALPYINEEFSISATLSGWIPAAFMLSTAILQIPCAKLADMVGRKKIFLLGTSLILMFCVLSGLASSAISLIIYRFLTGVGSAMVFGTSNALLMTAVPLEKRGMALGINTAVVYFSLSAGPFLGGILTQYLGWHSIFFFSALIALLVLIGGILFIHDDWREEAQHKFDFGGSVLYAMGLTGGIYGFSVLPSLVGFLALLGGMIILAFFCLYEKNQDNPVFNVRVFWSNRVFKFSSLAALISYSATFATSFILSLYLQYVRGLSPRDAGLILISQSLVQAFAALYSGKLSDKKSPASLATLGMAIISVGLVGLCFITETTSFYLIAALLLPIGIGIGVFSSPNMNVLMSSVEKKYYGLASATAGTMRLVGQSLSMGIAMMAISFTIGKVPFSPEVHSGIMSSLQITFIVCSILCFIGIYASSVRGRDKSKN